MSRRVYFIQRQISFSQFANVLAIPSLDVQLDDSPANSYPSVRLTLGDASLMARTYMDGHVFQLDASRQIVDTIAELFNTETREDCNLQSVIPWAPKFEVSEKAWESKQSKAKFPVSDSLIQAQGAVREGALDSFPYR